MPTPAVHPNPRSLCSGPTAHVGGREHAAEEGGQDFRPDGQEQGRPAHPGGVPGGEQGRPQDCPGADARGRIAHGRGCAAEKALTSTWEVFFVASKGWFCETVDWFVGDFWVLVDFFNLMTENSAGKLFRFCTFFLL